MFRGFLLLLLGAPAASGQLIIAHRGASFDAPENTLAAFRLAWERGADGIEGDFRVTGDGKIVCIHDDTTERTARGKKDLKVAGSTFEELRQLDVGAWKGAEFAGEKIPTLGEVLATVPRGRMIFIEVKCGPEIVPLLEEELKAQSHVEPEQIVIISFHEEVVRECRKELPMLKVNWLTSFKRKGKVGPWTPSPDKVMETLRRIRPTGVSTNAEPAVVKPAFVSRVKEAGFGYHCWTINDPEQARKFAGLGARSITTDRPAVIREAVGLLVP
jgi:glycerophosphoryl diester phosphodiesterase